MKSLKHYYNLEGKLLSFEEVNKIERIFTNADDGNAYPAPQVIKVNEKYGVVLNTASQWQENTYDTIVPVIYDDIITKKYDQFYYGGEDVFGVKINNKWGLINNNQKIILPADYDSLNLELSDDLRHWLTYQRFFVVKQNNKWGILGKTDDESDSLVVLLPFEYDEIGSIYYSYLYLKKDHKFQIFNSELNTIINIKKYNTIQPYKNESVNDFFLFKTLNTSGVEVFIGKNGVEFFKSLLD
jgi:hypothetical protein